MFVHREHLGQRYAELRLRGKGLSTSQLRPLLPASMHGLLVRDGSEAHPSSQGTGSDDDEGGGGAGARGRSKKGKIKGKGRK